MDYVLGENTSRSQGKLVNLAKKAEIEALRNDDAFMSELLGRWYDDAASGKKGSANYCDLDYLGKNKIDGKAIDRDAFTSIRYDDKLDAGVRDYRIALKVKRGDKGLQALGVVRH